MRIDQSLIKNLMKQLKMEDVDAKRVIIERDEGNIIIENPDVKKMDVQGKSVFQITGEVIEEEIIEVSEEDIKLIMEKTGCTEEEAIEALSETNDIAEAILKLSNKKI